MTGGSTRPATVLEEAIEQRRTIVPAAAARASLIRLLVRLRTGGPDGWRPRARRGRDRRDDAVFERRPTTSGARDGVPAARVVGRDRLPVRRRRRGVASRPSSMRGVRGTSVRSAGPARRTRRRSLARPDARRRGDRPVRGGSRADRRQPPVGGHPARPARRALRDAGGVRPRARASSRAVAALLEELGLDDGRGAHRHRGLAGRDARRRATRRPSASCARSYEALEARGERYVLSTVAGCSRRRSSSRRAARRGGGECGDRSRELASDGDIATQALWRRVRGRVFGRRGELAEAELMIREALAVLEPTDATVLHIDAQLDLGEVLAPPAAPTRRGRPTSGRAASPS